MHLRPSAEDLLKSIQSFFGTGVLVIDKTKNSWRRNPPPRYSVNSLDDIINIIIPRPPALDKYPLLTKKRGLASLREDFLLFKRTATAVLLIKDKKHLTVEGGFALNEIISIRASMNKGLTETLTENFPSIVPVVKPLVELPEFINPY